MASTMGRAGVNILSPVRMAEKTSASDSVARASRDRSSNDDSMYGLENKDKERQVKNWLDDVTESTHERLPFPTSYSSNDTSKLANDGPGMQYSRSQDLPISSFSPSKASISPRLSPRRSPRQSPMRMSVESNHSNANSNNGGGSSGSNTWRSRGSLDSQPEADAHDYSNSVSRSLSAVEDATSLTTTASNNALASSNNEELLAQLEVLKMQNQMLTSRIQRAQQDSHLELERERNQRQLAVSELTQQNQQLSNQLNQTQLEAQAALALEKEQFLLNMKQMQQERELLDERVRRTEEIAENEQKLVRMQKAQLHDTLAQLEADKVSLLSKLSGNAQLIKELQIRQISMGNGGGGGSSSSGRNNSSGRHTESASGTSAGIDDADNTSKSVKDASTKHSAARASPGRRALPFPTVFAFSLPSDTNNTAGGGDQLSSLQSEQTALTNSLEQISQQKNSLHIALQDTESAALYNHSQLTLQLANEKSLLELRVSKMCAEQAAMAERLAQAERTVHDQNAQFEAQRAAEHDLAQQNLDKLQLEQHALLTKISDSREGSTSASKSGSFIRKAEVDGHKGGAVSDVEAKDAAAAEAQRLLDLQLQQMTAAMEDLKKQLLLTELASVERENALKEANKREKEELKRTVQRMKEEFQASKMLQELEYLRETDTSAKGGGSGSGKGGANSTSNNVSEANFTPIKSTPSATRMSPLMSNTNTGTGSPNTTNNTHSGSNNSSRRNSRMKQPSPGSPSLASKHLSSHRSLFDLLTLDYTAQMQSGGSNTTNILNTTTNINNNNNTTNTTNRNKGGFNPHAIHTPELGAPQYRRESSYHKITLPDVTEEGEDLSGSSPRHSPKRSSTTPRNNNNNRNNFHTTGKSRTIMDLDSDSEDEDAWGKEVQRGSTGGVEVTGTSNITTSNGSGGKSGKSKKSESSGSTSASRAAKNKLKQKLQQSKGEKERERGESTPQTSRTVSPTSPVPNSNTSGGTSSTANANTTLYKPTPNTTSAHTTTNTSTSPAKSLATSSHDYSTYNVDQVSGLPAPHSAAAMNDVARLKGFAAKQMSLLQSLDQAQRQPIFYAAAYGRVEAVRYLLETLPDQGLGVQFGMQWVRGDIHGDTPVHAAASSGCAISTDLLLAALAAQSSIKVDTGVSSIADLRNSMQMTPAHLCSTAEALDVLFRYHADLEAQDVHSRTPLFIACAMNREVCAEYLIDCLDHAVSTMIIEGVNNLSLNRGEGLNHSAAAQGAPNKNSPLGAEVKTLSVEDKMMHTDRRGDTPLHAAACNGAVECLLLLLQHGIDPRLKNLTGLKAIDLAVRNRHKKCKDILAEYHLHYCTSGDFDSVLFLATLEGHRRIADAAHLRDGTVSSTHAATTIHTGQQGIDEYRIIQEHPVEHNTNTSTTHGTASANSTTGGGKVRFANPFGISTEDVNTVDKDIAETSKALHKAAQSMFSLRANKSMRLQRLGAWIAYHDTQSDSVFWYNHETSRGQWEEPAEVHAIKHQPHTSTLTGGLVSGGGTGNKQDIFEKTLPAKMSMRIKRYGDWIEYVTEAGRTFYYNDKDGSFQWDPPFATEHSSHSKARSVNTHHTDPTTTDTNNTAEGEANAHYPWRAYIDPESGSVFWYNEVTFVSQWELPAEFEAEAFEANTAPHHKASRSDKTRESLDLSSSLEAYNIDTQHQKNDPRGGSTVRRSRLHSSSFGEDEHAVAVWDHENDLGI